MPAPKRIIVYLTTEQHVRKRMKEKGGMDAYDFVLGVSCWNEKINDAGKGCMFNSPDGRCSKYTRAVSSLLRKQSRKLEDAPRAGLVATHRL